MRFLSLDESDTLDRKLRRRHAGVEQPKAVLYYTSGRADYAAAAKLIAHAAGPFSESVVLFSFCLTGDGWTEHNASDPRWRAYRDWRKSLGEERHL